MSDSLDPLNAIVSGFTDSITRFLGVMAASFGGHVLGLQVHSFAPVIASIPTMGVGAFGTGFDIDLGKVVLSWFGTFLGSVAIPWCWPFLALDLWLLTRLRLTGEVFSVIVILAAVQPIHTFLVQQRFSPLNGGQVAIGMGLLVLSAIVTTALLLWWRHTSDHAPDPLPDEEPEL
jgi:hypothetical protein